MSCPVPSGPPKSTPPYAAVAVNLHDHDHDHDHVNVDAVAFLHDLRAAGN